MVDHMTDRLTAAAVACVVTCATLAGHAADQPSRASIATLAWMAGSWVGAAGGVDMEEHWTSAKAGTMVGMHRDIAKGRTVSFEFLRIEEQDGVLVYMSSPRGAPPTPFRLVESGPARAVFANPSHDFPQRIIYWKDGADLRARIEGPQQGKTVGEEWRWRPGTLQ